MSEAGRQPLADSRKERYALGRVAGMTGKAAFEAAGWADVIKSSGGNVNRIEHDPDVVGRMAGLKEIAAEKFTNSIAVTRGEVVEGFRENIRKAKQGNEILGKDGAGSGVFRRDFAAVNKGFEAIGKSIGMFVDTTREEDFDAHLENMDPADIKPFLLGLLEQVDPNLKKMFVAAFDAEAKAPEEEGDGGTLQ